MLATFMLVNSNSAISPQLVTIREYGRWFEEVFDKYTSQLELYMKSRKNDGNSLLEWHPGTKIGNWFDKQNFDDTRLNSWYIYKDSKVIDRLVRYKLAESRDCSSVVDNHQAIRVYTLQQIELYIKSTIDKNFNISEYVGVPKQIKISAADRQEMKAPVTKNRTKLFYFKKENKNEVKG